ncbi:MAG: hypothetical protein JNK49_06840 [Planctomycetes bacterium]|nr:hypothetical protein [Planctomycetota bacterium]
MRSLLISALLAVPAVAQTWTLSDFGRPCGGDLSGQVVASPRGVGLRFAVTGATPNAVAVLALGQLAPTPIQLPGSQCLLLVDPRHTLFATTDAQGQAGFQLSLPNIAPISIEFQAVVIELTRAGRLAESTDGVRLVGR